MEKYNLHVFLNLLTYPFECRNYVSDSEDM